VAPAPEPEVTEPLAWPFTVTAPRKENTVNNPVFSLFMICFVSFFYWI
jgi:hypothetical protein